MAHSSIGPTSREMSGEAEAKLLAMRRMTGTEPLASMGMMFMLARICSGAVVSRVDSEGIVGGCCTYVQGRGPDALLQALLCLAETQQQTADLAIDVADFLVVECVGVVEGDEVPGQDEGAVDACQAERAVVVCVSLDIVHLLPRFERLQL